MMNASSASQSRPFPQEWHMPIIPESYPDRRPKITNEEKRLMKQYVSAAGKTMTGGRAKRIFDQLARFEQPYVDTVRLISQAKGICIGRRHLYTFMIRTGLAFWAWSKETWVEVIQTVPKKHEPQGVRLWMMLLAYLFSNVLYVGASTAYGFMANSIFGKAEVDAEVEKLCEPLIGVGYEQGRAGHQQFRWLCALAFLVNRHPEASELSASTLATVETLLANVESLGSIRGRRALLQLQLSLCELGILDEPVILASRKEAPPFAFMKNDETVDPLWLAWVQAYYEQTPRFHEEKLRHECYHLLTAGRWLRKKHPEVREPIRWDEALAREYVVYTCLAFCGDLTLPSHRRYASCQDSR